MSDFLKLGIIGATLIHTKSPQIQEAGLKYLGQAGEYKRFEIIENEFSKEINQVLGNLNGANVTIPYKEAILKYLNEFDPLVKRIGATNTLVISKNGIYGYNTDYYGFKESLAHNSLEAKTVSIIGAGGACKAVIIALEDMGVEEIYVYARNTSKVDENIPKVTKTKLHIKQFTETENLSHSQLIINSTPVGQGRLANGSPLTLGQIDLLRAETLVYDLIYDETLLLKESRKRDLKTIDGSQMLVLQAAKSLSIWTEKELDQGLIDAMQEAYKN
ncbi:MAG: shikimate dehydrogenase [Candidatus Caenarcaniphilales bacterium]|jgi:shikimate dehydrogenase|nr:shikimate dehydrogenase [Candidatus Caenarcaniphilales bacterium]